MADYCPQCGSWTWAIAGSHKCKPRWLVWRPENGETVGDAHAVHAANAEDAAKLYAERSDRKGEYNIVRGSDATVHVRRFGDARAEVEVFVVSAEAVPSYSARKVEAPREEPCKPCSWCKGEHHFCDAYRAEDGDYVCKHCDITVPPCKSCGEAVPWAMFQGEHDETDDALAPLCAECKGSVRQRVEVADV